MQQLADENETATSRANALTSELGAVRELLEQRENEVIAQGAVVSQLAAEREQLCTLQHAAGQCPPIFPAKYLRALKGSYTRRPYMVF